MASQRWYMSWYLNDHTVRDFALQKRKVLCRGYAKLVWCVTGCLTSNPNSNKGKVLVVQGVDLDTTYIKGGKSPRKCTSFLRLKLLYILYCFLAQYWLDRQSVRLDPLCFKGASLSYPRRERKPPGDRRSHHLPLKSTTAESTSDNNYLIQSYVNVWFNN